MPWSDDDHCLWVTRDENETAANFVEQKKRYL